MAEERVKGGNGGDERHELKRGNDVGVTRARREGKGEEEPVTVTPEAKELPGCEGRGDNKERGAVVARETRLPPQQLPTREG
eukprot:6207038-Pleurochrysis_carterae.AAC.1